MLDALAGTLGQPDIERNPLQTFSVSGCHAAARWGLRTGSRSGAVGFGLVAWSLVTPLAQVLQLICRGRRLGGEGGRGGSEVDGPGRD